MSRPHGLSRAYTSVSVIAVMGLLAGCSQPASYATVDLSGSYANGAPQTYSSRSGLPVYQSTQVYTTPVAPAPVYADTQVAYAQPAAPVGTYVDVPLDQVASLAPVYGGGFSAPARQSLPTFGVAPQGPIMSDAILTDETILRSDGFIDIGPYGGTQTAALAPGAGSIGFQSLPLAPAIPDYAPVSPQYESIAPAAPLALVDPLPPLYGPEPILAEPLPAPAPVTLPAPSVGLDYAEIAPDPYGTFVERPVTDTIPQYSPSESLIETAPLDVLAAPRADIAAVPDYSALNKQRATLAPQPVALPNAVPNPVEPEPIFAAPLPAPNGRGIVRPPASREYVRPYDALRPGFFPPYEFAPEGDLISEAPETAPEPVLASDYAAFVPAGPVGDAFELIAAIEAAPLEQATVLTVAEPAQPVYTVQSGDTLYGIAREHGVTPHTIAETNGIALSGTIHPGDTLSLPGGMTSGGPETLGDAPIVVLKTAELAPVEASIGTFVDDESGQEMGMVDVAALARMFRERESDDGIGLPMISAEAGQAMRGSADLSPTEVISDPLGPVATAEPVAIQTPRAVPEAYVPAPMPVMQAPIRYAWPVQGEVYRLAEGQIEIAAPFGAPVTASASGRIVHVENGPRGYLVVIEHDDGWRSLTLGLSGTTVAVGERVMQGATLGMTGMDRIRLELRDGGERVAETLGVLRS